MSSLGRHALVVSSARYSDPSLQPLAAPTEDAEALAAVLRDPNVGGFRVREVVDQPSWVVAEEVERFFTERMLDDVALFYFTGHGIKDEDGALYFAAMNTKSQLLRSTAVPSDHMVAAMRRCRSRRQVLLLDCCYAGAFSQAMFTKGNQGVGVQERFATAGTGRVVMTASDAMQYSFEGDRIEGEASLSLFTNALVQGLRTGEADRNGDGLVSLDELYDYVYESVSRVTPSQTPTTSNLDKRGEMVIAFNPHAEAPKETPGAAESMKEVVDAADPGGSGPTPSDGGGSDGLTGEVEPPETSVARTPPVSNAGWTARLLEKNWRMRRIEISLGRRSHILDYQFSVTSPRVLLDGRVVSTEYTGTWNMKHLFAIGDLHCAVEVKQSVSTLRIKGIRLIIDNQVVYSEE